MTDALVWYAAFGSNLLEARFLAYLRGGAVPRSGKPQHGARDGSDPLDNRPYRIGRALGFGYTADRWEGQGVAFVDPAPVDPPPTLGRAWLITVEQLSDVWAQENSRTVGPDLDLDRLVSEGSADLGDGWYRRLDYLGQLDGSPVATITCDVAPPLNPAGPAYLSVLRDGLMEVWDLSAKEAADYLAERNIGIGS